jgi:predicted negative regulator of RcsB-dependent stress response
MICPATAWNTSVRRISLVESDEEQIEVLKKWWDENGTSLLATIVLVVGGSMGYRAWENNVRETGESASALYENLVAAAENISSAGADYAMSQTAVSLGQELKTDYAGSTYSVFGALHLAKVAVDAGDLETAEQELKWVLDQDTDGQLETLARTRLARVLLEKQDATAALAQVISYQPPAGQVSSFEEVKGDILLELGNRQEAREAYQKALDSLTEEVSKPLLELKLADIPVEAAIVESVAESAESEGDA